MTEIYYAFTDLQIINMVNIRANISKSENATLVILLHNRINKKMIELIKEERLFNDIIVFEMYSITISTLIDRYLSPVINGKKTLANFKKTCLPNSTDDCSRIFIAGFWRYAEYIIKILIVSNPNLKISIVEEGSNIYTFSLYQLTYRKFAHSSLQRLKETIITVYPLLIFGMIKPHAVSKYITRIDELYTYSTDIRLQLISETNQYLLRQLPTVNRDNKIVFDILNKLSNSIGYLDYKYKKFIYISAGNYPYEPEFITLKHIFTSLHKIIGGSNLIIKQHPENKIPDQIFQDINPLFKSSIYIDNNNYSIEAHYNNIDLNEKVLITYFSSSTLNAKLMFGYEPYIIFINRLYPEILISEKMERVINQLIRTYANSSRIFIPKSIDEFENVLYNLNNPSNVIIR